MAFIFPEINIYLFPILSFDSSSILFFHWESEMPKIQLRTKLKLTESKAHPAKLGDSGWVLGFCVLCSKWA